MGPRDSRATTWQKRHQEEFEKAGLRWGHVEAPDVVKASPWFAALPEREQDLVIFTVLTQPDAVSLDVGQSIGRQRVRSCPDISLTAVSRWRGGRPQSLKVFLKKNLFSLKF